MFTTAVIALGLWGSTAWAGPAAFVLKPDWKGPAQRADVIDVNLGNTPETFVRAAYSQITGKLPSKAIVDAWAAKLRKEPTLRRVDVVRILCKQLGHPAKLKYSDPWANDPELAPAGPKRAKRDIGAVLMFFFNCPGGVNCGMDWANNHVLGMDASNAALGGYYDPKNAGFWRHELRDAKAAGLDFLLANVYGPDLQEGKVKVLAQALAAETAPLKIGLLDDTWAWGEPWFGPTWKLRPDLNQPAAASVKLYEAKWKPFFTQVDRKHWYLVDGKPMIYLYNAGKLLPLTQAAGTFKRMKMLFKRDFGVEPFLVVDQAYFADAEMPRVADARFIWDPLFHGDDASGVSRSQMKGKLLCHAVTRWDAVGRDKPGAIAGPQDRLVKGPEQLAKVLASTADADLLVLGTWNDLGEGTGLNRCYDYWYQGRWLAPDHFISLIRDAAGR